MYNLTGCAIPNLAPLNFVPGTCSDGQVLSYGQACNVSCAVGYDPEPNNAMVYACSQSGSTFVAEPKCKKSMCEDCGREFFFQRGKNTRANTRGVGAPLLSLPFVFRSGITFLFVFVPLCAMVYACSQSGSTFVAEPKCKESMCFS